MDWTESLATLQTSLERVQQERAQFERALDVVRTFETQATADIAHYLRQSGGIQLNVEAIQATPARPYALVQRKHDEWYLIHWRGVEMPMFGVLEKQDAAFNYFRVTRWMDLMTPFPQWAREEMEIKPPEHGALVDGTRSSVRVTAGDEGSFKKKYGAFLGKKQDDGSYTIKGGDAWIKLVAGLLKDGILPYQPQPVAPELWDAHAACPIRLREYQKPAVNEFLEWGSMSLLLPPGGGKSYVVGYILAHFRGRVLLVADGTLAVEQWKKFIAENAPQSNVTVTTYQGALKYVDAEFDLFVDDEAHHIAANTFSRYAFIKTKYRIGPTATALREDGREYMIIALNGKPYHVPWADLIRGGVLKKPNPHVVKLQDLTAKTNFVKQLVGKHKRGHVLIFCDWLQEGQALANLLSVPYVHGDTRNKLETIRENKVCVVSRIADTTLDLPELTLVIDYGFQKNARAQVLQRIGRLLHSEEGGDYYLLLTAEEAASDPRRLYAIQQELLGVADIDNIDLTAAGASVEKVLRGRAPARTRVPSPAGITMTTAKPKAPKSSKPQSEMDELLAHPAIAKLITKAEDGAGVKIRQEHLVTLVLKRGWNQTVDPEALKAIMSRDTAMRYKTAFEAAIQYGLALKVTQGYTTNIAEIKRIVALAKSFKR